MQQNILESVIAFTEHQLLKTVGTTPKFIDKDSYKLNVALMAEELNEYNLACKKSDIKEIADALGDMAFVLMGIIVKHGMQQIFLDQILRPICLSNATKFCDSRDEALQSIKALRIKKGAPHHYSEWAGKYVIFNSDTMKLAKGINYKEPLIIL